jgi:hypothetical protein
LSRQAGSILDDTRAHGAHRERRLNNGGLREALGIGANDPIEAGEGGFYLPDTAPSESIGRGRAICENAIVMQISPRFGATMGSI